jgi:hypothetical protein
MMGNFLCGMFVGASIAYIAVALVRMSYDEEKKNGTK